MHPDIEKLITIAKESGEVTEKQKEIILRKAEKLGEDIDEVEMILESLKLKRESAAKGQDTKLRKCPRCGAIVPAMEMKCPECGFSMEREADSSAFIRDYISELQREFTKIDSRGGDYYVKMNKKMTAIKGFTVPLTKQAQLMAFNFANSRYLSMCGRELCETEKAEKAAWLSKAKEFYSNIASMENNDSMTEQWLEKNKEILTIKGRKKLSFGSILIIVAVFVAVYYEWTALPWGSFWRFVVILYTLIMLCIVPSTMKDV